ncbi:MAG: hypothetical protein Q8N99_00765 [Nanoarchaeota archaeon]|nr:hypothetical protein [Nanoarchaeota archaeon]
MKRKAIQLANQTIVISLPSKWVKEQGIKKGDDIDVEERGKELIINSKGSNEEEKIEIDISGLNERTVRWILSGLQKKGYDEIIVKYDKSIIVKTIEELIKDLFTGFIISEQSENRCVLKSISKSLENEFDTTLRRAFLVTLSMGESCLETIKRGNLGNLKELISLEHTNNQLTNFCERILNKWGYDDYKQTCFMYVIVWNLEKICDEYKYICEYLSENNKLKIRKEVIELFEKTNIFLNSYYEIFYKFDIKKLSKLAEEKKEIEKKAIKFYKTKECKETIIINHLLNIISKVVDFSTSMIILKM